MIPAMNKLASLTLTALLLSPLAARAGTAPLNEPAAAITNAAPPPPAQLTIDPAGPVKKFSPVFNGLMTEEINHSYDGGLYAELIRNRAFLDNETNPEAWSLNVPANAEARMALSNRMALTDKLPVSLEVSIGKVESASPVALANEGYWGIPVKPDTSYKVSFYAMGNRAPRKKKESLIRRFSAGN